MVMAQQDILPPLTEDDRMLSGLVYPLWLFLGPIVLYGSKKDEPYLHFNALQAIALGVSSLVGSLAVFLVTWFLMWLLPGAFITMSAILGMVVFTAVLLAVLFYLTLILFIAWRVANGKFLRLPFIGLWAEKKMQQDLNITPESYSTAIFGSKRANIKISNFDYRNAPGYVEEKEELTEEADPDEAYYNPDTGTYEYDYNPADASPEALLSYEDANAPQSGLKNTPIPTAARPGGFQAHAPRAAAQPTDNRGFKPLAYQFSNKESESGSERSAAGQFKPLTPHSSAPPVPPPVVAGQRPASAHSQFKPLTPHASAPPVPPPVVAGQRPAPAHSQFKPLTPQSKPTSSLSGQPAPKFQWSKDFGQTGGAAPAAEVRSSEGQEANTSENGSFKPGLVSSNKPRSEAPRFQWDKLGGG